MSLPKTSQLRRHIVLCIPKTASRPLIRKIGRSSKYYNRKFNSYKKFVLGPCNVNKTQARVRLLRQAQERLKPPKCEYWLHDALGPYYPSMTLRGISNPIVIIDCPVRSFCSRCYVRIFYLYHLLRPFPFLQLAYT